MPFVKRRAGAHPDFFAAEAAGLRWLADGGAPTVRVVDVGPDHITLDRLESVRPTSEAARRFGVTLARMHFSGAPRFGSPPAGFNGRMFIGTREMSSVEHDRWGEFYATERVLPYVRVAMDAGTVTRTEVSVIERACDLIASGAFDGDELPSRLHGDLWTGNVLWTAQGVVLIDPAAHGGHRETDLAMLALFGCPHLADVVEGYVGEHDLGIGWRDRIPVHQLHPLAVHAAGHGRSYGVALAEAAERTLALARA